MGAVVLCLSTPRKHSGLAMISVFITVLLYQLRNEKLYQYN